jgi:hypothetical protein
MWPSDPKIVPRVVIETMVKAGGGVALYDRGDDIALHGVDPRMKRQEPGRPSSHHAPHVASDQTDRTATEAGTMTVHVDHEEEALSVFRRRAQFMATGR